MSSYSNSIPMGKPLESPSVANQQIVKVSDPGTNVQIPVLNPNLYDYLSLLPVVITADPILRQWHYRERSRQAKWSFNISLVLAVVTTAFGIGTAVSLSSGNMTEAMATAVISLVSGAVTQRSFDLYKEANQRFDEAAKALSKE